MIQRSGAGVFGRRGRERVPCTRRPPAGFGAGGRTSWKTPNLWLRREFTLGALTPAELAQVVLNVSHRGDCEIYLNGVLAAKLAGRTSTYVMEPLSDEARAALIPNGPNVLAIQCHEATGPRARGSQFIDAGLSKAELQPD